MEALHLRDGLREKVAQHVFLILFSGCCKERSLEEKGEGMLHSPAPSAGGPGSHFGHLLTLNV